jgi:hypothetical protein
VHGGVDKAILAYSADHYPLWREELGIADLPYGAFGENFSHTDLTEQTVCLGDVWQVGEVRVEVSQTAPAMLEARAPLAPAGPAAARDRERAQRLVLPAIDLRDTWRRGRPDIARASVSAVDDRGDD